MRVKILFKGNLNNQSMNATFHLLLIKYLIGLDNFFHQNYYLGQIGRSGLQICWTLQSAVYFCPSYFFK